MISDGPTDKKSAREGSQTEEGRVEFECLKDPLITVDQLRRNFILPFTTLDNLLQETKVLGCVVGVDSTSAGIVERMRPVCSEPIRMAVNEVLGLVLAYAISREPRGFTSMANLINMLLETMVIQRKTALSCVDSKCDDLLLLLW